MDSGLLMDLLANTNKKKITTFFENNCDIDKSNINNNSTDYYTQLLNIVELEVNNKKKDYNNIPDNLLDKSIHNLVDTLILLLQIKKSKKSI